MRAIVLVGIFAIAGCAYEPGSFNSTIQSFPGQRVSFGCLDVSVSRKSDLATGESVVGYAFGNRCDHPTVVDLASLRVYGYTSDGRPVELSAYDPDHEIAALLIDGRAVGRETIAYTSEEPTYQLCIDAATIARAPVQDWLCFQ